MKNPARLGWLVAVLLALSLIAPFSSASAAQTDATPTAPPSETVLPSQTPEPSATTAPEIPVAQPTDEIVEQPVETVDEPVVAAALGDLKIYSKNDANEDVAGATYAIYDSTCTSLLAGPTAADEFGTLTFTGVAEQGTQVCIVVTVTPAGYLDPIGVVITLSTERLLTEWSFVFTAAPEQTYDLPIFKEDSETGAKLGGAGFTLYAGACPATGISSFEQFTGPSDAVDGSAGRTIFEDLAAGTFCVVETTAPSGYSGGGSATLVLPDNASGWTFQNAPLPEETYDLPIFKEDSGTGAKLGGAGFTLYAGACPATGTASFEQFTGPADAVDGSAGRTIFTDLAAGTYCVVETTAPAGYTGGGSATVSLPENASGWTFENDPVLTPLTFDLPVYKEDSETGAKLGGAGFTLFYDDCTGNGAPVGPEQFTGDASAVDGSAGRTIFTELVAGDYCLVETTAPTGYFRAGPVTVNLPDNEDGWTVLNDPIDEIGTLEIEKSFCAVDDPEDAGTYFGAIFGPEPADCELGAASFYIWPTSDPTDITGPITTNAETGFATIDLEAGDYILQEISSGAQYEFEIFGDETTIIPVWNYTYGEGSLYLTKIYCKAKYDTTDISFDYPVDVTAAGWNGDHHKKCWQGDANFEIWPFGDSSNAISFNTGADGEVWLNLPETTAETGPHKLVETNTGTWAWFEIYDGQITYATVTNYFAWHHPHPEPTVTPVATTTVVTLPATGSGSSGTSAWYMLGIAVVGITGLAGIAIRRKPSGR